MSDQLSRVLRMALIGVYTAIPLVLALGTYRGWLFQSGTPGTTHTDIAAAGFFTLLAATMAAEYVGAFGSSSAGRVVLKGAACCLGALVWAVVVARLGPDTTAGGALLIGPLSALLLSVVFYWSRFAAIRTRAFMAAIMIATPTSMGQPTSGGPSARETTAWTEHSGQSNRVDIAAHPGKIAVRLVGGCAASLILGLVLQGTHYGGLNPGIFYAGAVFLGGLAFRSLLSRAPVVSFTPDGVSLRRDVSSVRHLPWAQISSFEMKSAMGNTFLVVHVKDPDALISQYGLFSRWMMGQSRAMFGSPVRIPVGWLRCDPNWLWQKANELLAASRGA